MISRKRLDLNEEEVVWKICVPINGNLFEEK